MNGEALLSRVFELGGKLWLEGDGLEYQLPDTSEARELLSELRQNRNHLVEMLHDQEDISPVARDQFRLWATDRCEYRGHWFTAIAVLNRDFNEWLFEQDEALCPPTMFGRLLREGGFLFADGLVNGLTLRSDVHNFDTLTYEDWHRLHRADYPEE